MPSFTFMPLVPTTSDVVVRLALTVGAGAMIGLNRGVRGHAAGLRTTILVGIAAALAMLQANELLSVSGKTGASFGVMDLMRMPLGILTGVGFIGGGAILHRGDFVSGVTTAATMWVMTVIGLCFGGGQVWLGLTGTAIAVATLWLLKWVDDHIPREQRAQVRIEKPEQGVDVNALPTALAALGFKAHFQAQEKEDASKVESLLYEIRWKRAEARGAATDLLQIIEKRFSVVCFELKSEFREE